MRLSCPEEYPVTLFVNGKELSTYQLTKHDLIDWTYGHLFSEGIINSRNDIKKVHQSEGIVSVILKESVDFTSTEKKKKHRTSGCGNGVTFFSMSDVKKLPKVDTDLQLSLTYLLKKRHEFAKASTMYNETGGMHGACIVKRSGEIVVREDIGRHNAVDKIIGYALRNNLNPRELVLLTTGRVSYEMLAKSARFGFGIIGSRTAATKQAVQLANYLGVEVVGYIRGRMSLVYTKHGKVYNDLTAVSST
ncbi:formate dehydrogenase accessory sulfurtransferase FdhD [Bacillus shivajii]|uniref:formate dehydrogenase accessory sulfurtransferase FdhD n=1 Tax=Bacillus shivajii TaxID=1983719 RepID=UPI001CFBE396|nr:formate dehydrogenase accessory sulfurtransferase FdhD [Bacillus shivajii]UCZ52394.1 formate dehydrogenase accessory sulfurtransferase FdhD [Bacillus shivajii]